MFKPGKYKLTKNNVTVFDLTRNTSRTLPIGEKIDILKVEEPHTGKIRGYISENEYIILKNMLGDVCADPVKAVKKKEVK